MFQEIVNRAAAFEYFLTQRFQAGIMLTGTEIKSIRAGKAGLSDAYCYINNGELFIKNMHIAPYDHGTYSNHEPRRDRKLLLRRSELRKIETRIKERGFTVIPVKLYLSERGLAKLEIALAQGKKVHDKRDSIKERDQRRDLDRRLNDRD